MIPRGRRCALEVRSREFLNLQAVIAMTLTLDSPIERSEAPLARSRCAHNPTCPSAESPDREAARCVAYHPEQGWALLCNGVISFDDTGELLPDGRAVPPWRRAFASEGAR
jgi:hypothetical protein